VAGDRQHVAADDARGEEVALRALNG